MNKYSKNILSVDKSVIKMNIKYTTALQKSHYFLENNKQDQNYT